MKKVKLDGSNTLFFTDNFPSKYDKKRVFKHIAVIGLGGNIGDVVTRFKRLFLLLKRDRRFHILKSSPILKNPPFGYLAQNYFYNALIVLQTSLSPKELLKILLNMEKIFKRVRSFKDGPRTLDLDIIFFDNLIYNGKTLLLPHPKWHTRESVLIPLTYITKVRNV